MKKLYITLLILVVAASYAQTTIFTENMGVPAGNTAISANTFQNSAPILFSGNADIRKNTPSDYPGASGDGFVFLAGTTENKNIIIEGINTLNYTDLTLSFGQQKGTNVANNQMTVQVSEDGTNWTPLTYTRPTGAGTSIWIVINPTGTIPATANLRVKFENPMSNAGFRIDDVKITGNQVPLTTKNNEITALKIYPNPVTNGNLFISSDNSDLKTVEIYNVLGKRVLAAKVTTESVNVSKLAKGVYLLKATENDKTVTRKIVIE